VLRYNWVALYFADRIRDGVGNTQLPNGEYTGLEGHVGCPLGGSLKYGKIVCYCQLLPIYNLKIPSFDM